MNAVQFLFFIIQNIGVWNQNTHAEMLAEAEKWYEQKQGLVKYASSWWAKLVFGVVAPIIQTRVTSWYEGIKDEDQDGDIDLIDIMLHLMKKRAAKRGEAMPTDMSVEDIRAAVKVARDRSEADFDLD